MARVALTPSALVPNSNLADPSGTASTSGAGNGFSVAGNARSNVSLWFRVVGTNAGNVTVLAGSQPSAISSGQGALTVAVGSGATQWIGPLDSSRFQQSDGSIIVETSAVMNVTAFTLDGRRV